MKKSFLLLALIAFMVIGIGAVSAGTSLPITASADMVTYCNFDAPRTLSWTFNLATWNGLTNCEGSPVVCFWNDGSAEEKTAFVHMDNNDGVSNRITLSASNGGFMGNGGDSLPRALDVAYGNDAYVAMTSNIVKESTDEINVGIEVRQGLAESSFVYPTYIKAGTWTNTITLTCQTYTP